MESYRIKRIFKGHLFNSNRQVLYILNKKDAKQKTLVQLCEESFNKALNNCEIVYAKQVRRERLEKEKKNNLKRKEGLKLKQDSNDKPATLSNLKMDVYYALNKKVTIDDVSLVVDMLFKVIRKYLLQGVTVRIATLCDLFLKPSKPIFNGITGKYRIGVMKLCLKANVLFRKEISNSYPYEEYSKEDFNNPYKSDF